MDKDTLKSFKGITLIALIVTIIVLLILAGIAISMISGNNGILTKTVDAKTKAADAAEFEKVRLAVGSSKIAGLGNVDENDLKQELNKEFGESNYKYEDGIITIGKNKYVITESDVVSDKGTNGIETVPAGYKGIYNVDDLNNIRNNTSGKYILMNDIYYLIDEIGENWEPIDKFSGVLNGNGKKICSLTYKGKLTRFTKKWR